MSILQFRTWRLIFSCYFLKYTSAALCFGSIKNLLPKKKLFWNLIRKLKYVKLTYFKQMFHNNISQKNIANFNDPIFAFLFFNILILFNLLYFHIFLVKFKLIIFWMLNNEILIKNKTIFLVCMFISHRTKSKFYFLQIIK